MASQRFRHRAVCGLLLLGTACGTVVGNPKKPGAGTDAPATSTISYKLPDLGISLPTSATSSDSLAFGLTDADHIGDGGRQLLVSWATRTQRTLTLVDTLSDHINKIIAAERAAGNTSDPLVFTNRGSDNQLSGKIQSLTTASGTMDYAYEATICNSGALVTDFRWSAAGDKVALLRDFSQKPDGIADSIAIVSAITMAKGTVTSLSIDLQGTYPDTILPSSAGNFVTEHSQLSTFSSGEFAISMVGDHEAAQNASGSYNGSTYLVGKLMPTATGSSADATTLAEFVGYFADLPACVAAGGLIEAAADLWQPTFTGPHFCTGRPLGATHFSTRQQFYTTLTDLQPLGLQSKTQLHNLGFAATLNCP